MIYFVRPRSGVASCLCIKDVFSADELDRIQGMILDPGEPAKLTGDRADPKVRQSSVLFLKPDLVDEWIFDKLSDTVARLNAQYFRFDVDCFESLQLATYEVGDHFDWHQDVGPGSMSRKLSLTLQLSDPGAYEGGDLELFTDVKPEQTSRERGMMMLFPSYSLHRVTPVTSGVRRSLVAWFLGPQFR